MTKLTKTQAARLLKYKRATSPAPRAYDDAATQKGLERLLREIRRESRVPKWLRKLIRR